MQLFALKRCLIEFRHIKNTNLGYKRAFKLTPSFNDMCVLLTFPIPGFSFTLDTARSRHGGAAGGDTCRMPLKLVG